MASNADCAGAESHPWVQQLAIVGEVRRMRLGMKGLLFHKLFFLNLTELEPDFSLRVFQRIIENYTISAGKCELKFNREQEYSSRAFPAFERTAFGNMLNGEFTCAWICGEKIAGGWLCYLDAFNNERSG